MIHNNYATLQIHKQQICLSTFCIDIKKISYGFQVMCNDCEAFNKMENVEREKKLHWAYLLHDDTHKRTQFAIKCDHFSVNGLASKPAEGNYLSSL